MTLKKLTIIFFFAIFFSACSIQMKFDISNDVEKQKKEIKFIIENSQIKTYSGWWIYGEEQHIFKDEKTLDEYYLIFPNENMKELKKLYLAMCEMEYFPMESSMTGYIQKHLLEKKTVLVVSDFEILYIQGCE